MRYEVTMSQGARFYVSAPDMMAAECEANWFMDNAGIIGDLDSIKRDESDNDDDN
jgi:hypothetical protein